MLNAIVRFSLRFRGIVIALAGALLIYGVYAVQHAAYDVFPEFASPHITVQTEAPGLAPEQVEVLVTQPVEQILNGVAGIESLLSQSAQGLSVLTMTFGDTSDIFRDRQVVAERLATLVGTLPQGVHAPVMGPLTSSTGDLLTVGLVSDAHSLMELRTIAEWTLKPQLLAVPGVAQVSLFGGEVKQLQIQVRPDQLVHFDVGIEDVMLAAQKATGVRGAGQLDTANQHIVLQSEGQSLTPEALAHTALLQGSGASASLNVRLGDVANVVEAPAPPISAASINGHPGVVINLWAQYGANTLEVTKQLETTLAAMAPTLREQQIELYPDLFRAATFINTAVRNVRHSLLIGAVLVVAVLYAFLFDVGTAAIACLAIPLSLLAAAIVLRMWGLTLNTMTIGGLAIAIGIVVDDAVIDIENIQRRVRENQRSEHPQPMLQVVFDASIEVRSAVVYATIAIIMVFVPLLTMPGLAGRLFAPLGIACILAILASLMVALTVTPALCYLLLSRHNPEHHRSPMVPWLQARYRRAVTWVGHSTRPVVVGVILCAVAGVLALRFLGSTFLPDLHEGHFIAHMTAMPGTSLGESLRIGGQVTHELLKLPIVRSVAQRAGRAESDDTFGTHSSEFEIDLNPLTGRQAEEAQGEIRRVLEPFPGVAFAVNTFLTERVEETLSGYSSPVIVNVFGNDLDRLDHQAQEVARVLEQVHGAVDVEVHSPPGTPQLMIRLRPDDVARWGFEPVDVLEAIQTAYQGEVAGQVYEGNRAFDVSVVLHPDARKSVTDIGALPLRSPAGVYVRLRQLCDIRQTAGRYVVLHDGARRVQTVTCNVEGRDLEGFVRDATSRVHSAVSWPSDMSVEFAGAARAHAASRHDLLVHSCLAVIAVMVLLFMVVGHARNLALVLVNLPFALVGGVVAVWLTGGQLSIGSMVGFVTLFGITLRNSIMMLSHYQHLVSIEGATWGPDTALRGASERLVPILMTALVTALGLLPIALGSGDPGREIEGPMAVVILGGLVTSTALNLLVLPMLALRFGRFEPGE